MKIHNIKYSAFLMILSFLSCTNLDEEVFSTITSNNFYKSSAEVEAAVSRPYSHLRQTFVFFSTDGASVYLLQELSTDEAAWPQKGRDGFDNGNWLRLHRHEWTIEDGSFKYAWNHLFTGIGFCNVVMDDLSKVTVISGEVKQKYMAELRGMRAFFYYYLLDLFGNVPICTEINQFSPGSSTRSEVYSFIETEIMDVYDQLNEYHSDDMYGRFSKQAADALLSRLYLNALIYTGVEQYEKCIEACERVLDTKSFSLESHWQRPFLHDNHLSAENIFVIPNDAINGNDQENIFKFSTHWAQREPQFRWNSQGGYNGLVTVREFIEKYDTVNDKRCYFDSHAFISGNENDPAIPRGQFLWGLQLGINGDTVRATNELNGKPLSFILDVPNMTDGLENAGARNIKYRVEQNASGFSNDLVIFRLAEIYFNWAESALRMGSSVPASVLDGINEIRSRAGVSEYSANDLTLSELYDEKGREMAYEAIRRTDMIRFGTYTGQRWDKSVSESYRTLYPVPQSSRNVNPNLTQNDGYPQ
jgi:hypothetical protein